MHNITLMPPMFGEEPKSADRPAMSELTYEVHRAEGEDSASCSNRGGLYIFIKPQVWVDVPWQRPIDVGYTFEIVESTGRDRNAPSISIKEPLSPYATEDGRYRFSFGWRDSAPNDQRSIELVLSVTAIDRWDRPSDPCFVRIRHPGGGVERAVRSESPVHCR
jgi:hypothetical protein